MSFVYLKTASQIYYLNNRKCQKCKDRCYEHLRYIRKNEEATGKHFNERGHTHWDFKFHIIEKVFPNTNEMRLRREEYWIRTLQSKAPKGFNRNSLT